MPPIPPSCEPLGPAFWQQPASAWSSLAFMVAGVAILVAARRRRSPATRHLQVAVGLLTALNGIGSVVQHGPAPSWNPVLHDPPLLGVLALVAADGIADLTGRPLRHRWWAIPTAVCVVLAAFWPGVSTGAQSAVAVVAVGVTLWRARRRPALRGRAVAAMAVLGVGGAIGTLSRPGWPWCDPSGAWFEAGWSGHAVWHVLAAVALWVIAPMVGRRNEDPTWARS